MSAQADVSRVRESERSQRASKSKDVSEPSQKLIEPSQNTCEPGQKTEHPNLCPLPDFTFPSNRPKDIETLHRARIPTPRCIRSAQIKYCILIHEMPKKPALSLPDRYTLLQQKRPARVSIPMIQSHGVRRVLSENLVKHNQVSAQV